MLEQERKLKINMFYDCLLAINISVPLCAAYVLFLQSFAGYWASTNHLAGPKVQLKNFWGPKAAHKNLGWPSKDLWWQNYIVS